MEGPSQTAIGDSSSRKISRKNAVQPLFLDHCECCSSADCSIDLNCIKSQYHKSHCECCLTYSIHLVNDESYDTYIYQSDKFTAETTDWLDDQEELIAIRSWTTEEKTDFVDLMLKEYVLNEVHF